MRRLLLSLTSLIFVALGSIATAQTIPNVPDADRIATYSVVSPTTNFTIPFAVYGDCTDITVSINGVPQSPSAFNCLSLSGQPFSNIARPITDAQVVMVAPVTSGTVVVASNWRPRFSMGSSPGISRVEINRTLGTIISRERDVYNALNSAGLGPGKTITSGLISDSTALGRSFITLPDAATGRSLLGIFASNTLTPGYIQLFGGFPDGSDITPAITAATAAPRRVIFEGGTFRINSDMTIPADVVLDVRPGSCLNATGHTVTVHGSFVKDNYNQIFCGGTFTGMAFARADWYGCTGTADNVCIQAAINAVENSFGSDGDKRQVGFECKVYKLSGGFTISPTNLWTHYDHGCGSGNVGTTFEVQAGFSGTRVVTIAGQARGVPGVNADYDIGDFLVTNPSNVPGLTCVAFAPTAGTQLEGRKPNLFSNVACEGLKFGRTYGAVREQLVDRFGFHSSEHGAFCAVYIPNDKFSVVGDLNAINQTCAPNGGTTLVASTDTTGTGYAYFGTLNGGGITGISEAGDFYASNLGFQFQAQRNLADMTDNSNIGISDIFLGEGSKTEIDGFQCGVVTMTADSTGTVAGQRVYISNVQLRAKYIRGMVQGCTMWNATTVGSGSGTATIDSLDFDAKFAANIAGYGVNWNNVRGGQIHAKWMDSGYTGTYAIKLSGTSKGISLYGNVCSNNSGNPTFTYAGFILLDTGTDYIAVPQGNITDGGCGTPLTNTGAGAHNDIGATLH